MKIKIQTIYPESVYYRVVNNEDIKYFYGNKELLKYIKKTNEPIEDFDDSMLKKANQDRNNLLKIINLPLKDKNEKNT